MDIKKIKAYRPTYNGFGYNSKKEFQVGQEYIVNFQKGELDKNFYSKIEDILDDYKIYIYDFEGHVKFNDKIKVFELEIVSGKLEGKEAYNIKIVKELSKDDLLLLLATYVKFDDKDNLIYKNYPYNNCFGEIKYEYDENDKWITYKDEIGYISREYHGNGKLKSHKDSFGYYFNYELF